MPRHEVNHLGVPPMDLTISEAGAGKLKVELNVPRSSGSQDNIPFLEVTRNEQQTLLNGARQDMLSKLSQSGFQIGDIKVSTGGERSQHGGLSGGAIVPEVAGKLEFEIKSDSKIQGNVETVLKNNPDLAKAIRETEQNFDTRRQDIYESRAREWHRNGGATIQGQNGETYHVGADAAKNYVNERHPLNPWKRVSADDGGVQVADASTLVPGNDRLNRQFEQALKGTNGDRDAAAVAVNAISQTPGYKPDQDIAVVQGRNGNLIATQGQGDTAVNVAVPQAQPGDFQRVSQQMAQAPQQVEMAQAMEQPQRSRSV